MKRRELLTGLFATSAFSLANGLLWKHAQDTYAPDTSQDPLVTGHLSDSENLLLINEAQVPVGPAPALASKPAPTEPGLPALAQTQPAAQVARVDEVRSLENEARILEKVRNFEQEFDDDIHLSADERILLHSTLARMEKVETYVGHGHYNILGFDQLLAMAKRAPAGEFLATELDFMERIFFADATRYGFFGEKVSDKLTQAVAQKDVLKVPYSGHYVYKGQSLNYYEKLKQDIGAGIILTSGIRSVVKQMHLFLAKAALSNYNLSKASRSLAPPGHSFHGIGDFDVGKVGWGLDNFSDKFAQTEEFKRMQALGYVQIRYTQDNRLGVRFEPWHIKVV